ncbi:MAG: DUF6364 family protein [Acidobacteria bacterium]|nr:DUF6364 family protein [Acidobacteriota bacterium]
MAKRNLTLSLQEDLIKRARIMAAQRDTSITALVSELLEDAATKHDAQETYDQAMAALLADMRRGYDLGMDQNKPSRDEAHER